MVENQAVENPNVTTANKTVNYGLPLWEKDDITSYMNDMNAAMNIIDDQMHANALVQGDVLATAEDAKSTAEEAMEVANSFNERINELVTKQDETSSAVEHLQSDVNDNTTVIGKISDKTVSLDARVGANEEAIGALSAKVDNVSAESASAKEMAESAESTAQNAETLATEAKNEVDMLQAAVDTNTDDINRLGMLTAKRYTGATSGFRYVFYVYHDKVVVVLEGDETIAPDTSVSDHVDYTDIIPEGFEPVCADFIKVHGLTSNHINVHYYSACGLYATDKYAVLQFRNNDANSVWNINRTQTVTTIYIRSVNT